MGRYCVSLAPLSTTRFCSAIRMSFFDEASAVRHPAGGSFLRLGLSSDGAQRIPSGALRGSLRSFLQHALPVG